MQLAWQVLQLHSHRFSRASVVISCPRDACRLRWLIQNLEKRWRYIGGPDAEMTKSLSHSTLMPNALPHRCCRLLDFLIKNWNSNLKKVVKSNVLRLQKIHGFPSKLLDGKTQKQKNQQLHQLRLLLRCTTTPACTITPVCTTTPAGTITTTPVCTTTPATTTTTTRATTTTTILAGMIPVTITTITRACITRLQERTVRLTRSVVTDTMSRSSKVRQTEETNWPLRWSLTTTSCTVSMRWAPRATVLHHASQERWTNARVASTEASLAAPMSSCLRATASKPRSTDAWTRRLLTPASQCKSMAWRCRWVAWTLVPLTLAVPSWPQWLLSSRWPSEIGKFETKMAYSHISSFIESIWVTVIYNIISIINFYFVK